MATSINEHVRWVVGRPVTPTEARSLPPIPNSFPAHQDGFFDRLGRGFSQSSGLVGAGAVIGGVIGGVAGATVGAGLVSFVAGGIRQPGSVAGGLPGSTTPVAPERLRVMTWNIHGGMGGPGKFLSSSEELDHLADEIRRQDPDVVLLQEVDLSAPRSGYRDTLSELAERLKPTSAVSGSGATFVTGRSQHVAIMTFHGVRVTNARSLVHEDPYGNGISRRVRGAVNDIRKAVSDLRHKPAPAMKTPPLEVRDTLDTMIHTPAGNDVRLLTGHYGSRTVTFDHPANALYPVAAAVGGWAGATILGADFNVRSATEDGSRERSVLGAAGLIDAFAAAGVAPGSAARHSVVPAGDVDIDRIYASSHMQVASVKVARDAKDASDHFPVIADLQIA